MFLRGSTSTHPVSRHLHHIATLTINADGDLFVEIVQDLDLYGVDDGGDDTTPALTPVSRCPVHEVPPAGEIHEAARAFGYNVHTRGSEAHTPSLYTLQNLHVCLVLE